jgi:hypothetical protein
VDTLKRDLTASAEVLEASLFHVRGVDQTKIRPGRGAKETRIDQFGNLGEQASCSFMLAV